MKNYILGDRLKPSMWLGVGIIGVAVAMVAHTPYFPSLTML